MPINKKKVGRFSALAVLMALLVGIFIFVELVREEIKTSKLQAHYLSEITKQLSFKVNPGASSAIRFPDFGPYDERLGYSLLPSSIARLQKAGYSITAQAESSPMMTQLEDYGLFSIYNEKTQAGLRILDQNNQPLFAATYPSHGYPNFEAVPPVVLYTLLYIENRELLKENDNTFNPAIEWDRLAFATLQMMARKLGADINVPGGSTLATQLEKYRHSENGYTNSILDKFRQMASASVRAYLLGPDTREMRRSIALAYLNSMPLAATAKLGEVHGLGDGLSAWFDADFAEINKLLSPTALNAAEQITPQQAQAYRQVLSILLSQRRPSYLLGPGYQALQNLTDKYLRLLADQGVISSALRDAALKETTLQPVRTLQNQASFVTEKKTQSVLRSRLAHAIGVKSNYELDRLDLTVKTTLDFDAQQAVTKALHRLNETDGAKESGILGFRLLNTTTDLSPVIYSLMLYERSPSGNLLRIQTDNYDQPLDINEGVRLDLGSTSKLRTMVHYLELVTDVYQQYHELSLAELKQLEFHPRDFLSIWVIDQLKAKPDINLEDLLNQAIDKKYSASPGESFFTGGGLHTFNNFDKSENSRIMSVREALKTSTNLVFIRLMRELTYHHMYRPNGLARWLESPEDPKRQEYLHRFADNEGKVYLRRFYARYQGKSTAEALAMLTKRVYPKASRLTMLYQAIYPNPEQQDFAALSRYLKAAMPTVHLSDEEIEELRAKYTPNTFDLQDQGYITKLHPLELWLVGYLSEHPTATRDQVLEASSDQRLAVYRWLLKSNKVHAQQRRILTMLEAEAFKEIHAAWKRVGYPFSGLTPSYATAIGASGDRPAALAELMGILVNDGVRLPVVRFESFHYAAATPYETLLSKVPEPGQRIFAPEIAKVARAALAGVVDGGTAGRLRNVYTDADGKPLLAGGKTGTGDHRQQIWGERGRLIASKFISRAATFTFFIGDRFFGVITAYVQGQDAEKFHFTSALPVQIMKFLKPTLNPLINKTTIEKAKYEPQIAVTTSDKFNTSAPVN